MLLFASVRKVGPQFLRSENVSHHNRQSRVRPSRPAGAPILLGESAHPTGVVAIRHVGTDYDAMTVPIGIAAAYTVENTQFVRYGRKADATAVAAASVRSAADQAPHTGEAAERIRESHA